MTSPPIATHLAGATPTPAELTAEKRMVALTSVLAAVLLTAFKAVVGLTTGSLGILSEAAHSLLDLVAAVMTLWAVRAAAQPADGRHTYGHGKFENLSALLETGLLLLTCVWIIYEAGHRLLGKPVEVEASPWAFVVMAISIVVDVSRSRALARVARKTGSQALEADALHFSTDVWSSSVVIFGLAMVWLAPRLGLPWLRHADTVAALVVALIVVLVSLQLGAKSVSDLLDAAPQGLREAITDAVKVAGVASVNRVRVRRSGPEAFVDLTVVVEPGTTLERSHAVADEAERGVRALLPGADVMVHVEPSSPPPAPAEEPVPATVRRLAAAQGVGVHSIHLSSILGSLALELHAELPGQLPVSQAHEQVSALEASLRQALPRIARIVTHIEPAAPSEEPEDATPHGHWPALEAVHEVLAAFRGTGGAHDVKLASAGDGLLLSLHWDVSPEMTLAEAHAHSERLEQALKLRLPELRRVVIHVEPGRPPAPASRR